MTSSFDWRVLSVTPTISRFQQSVRVLCLCMLLLNIPVADATETIDIQFISNSGAEFQTTNLIADVESYFGSRFEFLQLLLLETPALDDADYRSQYAVLQEIDHEAENYSVMFVIACAGAMDDSGYHTTTNVARRLMGDELRFRVRLLDANGVVRQDSLKPLSKEQLIAWLQQGKT